MEAEARTYSGGSWAFTNLSFYLQNMFDDDGNTSSYLAGRNNGTTADKWISVAMRLPAGTPPIVACDVYGNNGAWNAGTRRTVAYSVMGSYDGIALCSTASTRRSTKPAAPPSSPTAWRCSSGRRRPAFAVRTRLSRPAFAART